MLDEVEPAGVGREHHGFLANGGTGSHDARVIAHKIRLNSTDAQALLFETWAEALRRELGAVGVGAPAPRLRGAASDSSGTAEQAWSPVGEPWSSNPDAPKALGREPVGAC